MAINRLWPRLLIVLLASALRCAALGADQRFHPDEALFATFARGAAVQGDWLLRGSLDKTPLSIYATALGMMSFGVTTLPNGVLTLDIHRGEFAARVPNVFASIGFVALLMALTWRVTRRERAALMAGVLAAVSPLALAFSAVAFTDTLMLLCITAALYAAVRAKALWTGVWLALGIGCKQQAILYTPLLLDILWNAATLATPPVYPTLRDMARHASTDGGLLLTSRVASSGCSGLKSPLRIAFLDSIRVLLRFALPVVIGLLALGLWDAAREQVTGLWALAAANNDPGRLARLDELLPRLAAWLGYAQYLLALLPIAFLWASNHWFRIRHIQSHPPRRMRPANVHGWLTRTMIVYTGLYLLSHWLIAINIYDRYLLPLLPLAVLAGARALSNSSHSATASKREYDAHFATLAFCVIVLSLPAALDALAGRLPIGGDRGKHQGIDQLAAHLESKPLGTIIYDHWLGWELGYYLGTWSDKRRVYYPTPHALAADAPLNPDRAPRYIIAPIDVMLAPWLDALRAVGFTVRLDYARGQFVAYRVIPPQAARSVSVAESSWPGRIAACEYSCA